jgi:uncharacterized MAPEG superfamily protein
MFFTLHPGGAVMLAVLFLILFSLVLLMIIPDRWHARREIAKHRREHAARPKGRAQAATRAHQQQRTERN